MTKITLEAHTTVLKVDTPTFQHYLTLHPIAVMHNTHCAVFTSTLATEQVKYTITLSLHAAADSFGYLQHNPWSGEAAQGHERLVFDDKGWRGEKLQLYANTTGCCTQNEAIIGKVEEILYNSLPVTPCCCRSWPLF